LIKDSKTHYKRNILISIILSEALIISAFIFSPKRPGNNVKILYNEPVVLLNKIPRTVQNPPIQIQKPEIPPINITDEMEAFELLGDVSSSSIASNQNNIVPTVIADQNIRSVRTAPRLIFEVMPAAGDNAFSGKLELSLKINENGIVVDHRIISNSLDCSECLNEIIRAAYKSKWEPAMANGKKEDYWVKKSYAFK
jgi:hypothetical protein